MPPALDVLIASCLSHPTVSEYENESLYYPPNLPLTATLELANHPILDAVRNTLFPSLPVGHYLTAVRDKLELWPKGNGLVVQNRPLDNRVATILVTLPVKFRGGSLLVRSTDRHEEKFYGRGGKGGDLEWTAFMSDCEYEIQPVRSGCRLTISYAVQLKSFGPAGIQPDPLITPSDYFLDLLSPVLNLSRGRKIAFYLTAEYGVNPGDVLAESLVPNVSPTSLVVLSPADIRYARTAQGRRLDHLPRAQAVQAAARAQVDRWRLHLARGSDCGNGQRERGQPDCFDREAVALRARWR